VLLALLTFPAFPVSSCARQSTSGNIQRLLVLLSRDAMSERKFSKLGLAK